MGPKGERLNLLIATHIDSDHIAGLIALLAANGSSIQPDIVRIDHARHNSLRGLTAKNLDVVTSQTRTLLESVSRRGHPRPAGAKADLREISARQGSSLAALLHRGGYLWNLGDGAQSINAHDTHPLALGAGGSVRVIGPTPNRLDGLLRWWLAELRRLGHSRATGAGDVNTSVPCAGRCSGLFS